MLRFSRRLRCSSQRLEHDYAEYGIGIAEAYNMFGFSLGQDFNRKDVQESFRRLAQFHHPDKGGNPEPFRKIPAANKLLKAYAGRPAASVAAGGADARPDGSDINFSRENVDVATGRQGVGRDTYKDMMTMSGMDKAVFLVAFFGIYFAYQWYVADTAIRLSDSRSRMTADEVKPMDHARLEKASHGYHPWGADTQLRNEVEQLTQDRQARLDAVAAADPDSLAAKRKRMVFQ